MARLLKTGHTVDQAGKCVALIHREMLMARLYIAGVSKQCVGVETLCHILLWVRGKQHTYGVKNLLLMCLML